jgi:hypothetical protein
MFRIVSPEETLKLLTTISFTCIEFPGSKNLAQWVVNTRVL